VAFTVRIDRVFERALSSLAKSEGVSRQEIIRRALLERYERSGHRSRVADSTGRMVSQWRDVVERLSSE